ncbi:hypothetical protein Tco_0628390 [Tanacetum coccineum]|uniref:Uncharacterized protein n=1 Tax=Tanacetum coccineum TaxID=301880 RepID=A0ABQ4WQA9_9ASTR
MALRLLVLISPKWSATTATRGDILLGSVELQEIKTTRIRKAQEGVCLWKHLLPYLWCHTMVLVDMTGVIRQKEGPNCALIAFSSSSPDLEVSNDSIYSKSCLETVELLKSQNDQLLKDLKKFELMVLVPPPYTGNFMPPTPNLSFTGLDEFVNELVVENCKAISSEEEPKVVRKYDDAPSIKE